MNSLQRWTRRPQEEANLFNPPFLCALIYELIKPYSKERKSGATVFLIAIAMTLCLQRTSRERLPYSTVTAFFSWVQDNEDLLIGFAQSSKNLAPYIKEAVLFGFATHTLQIGTGAAIELGRNKATFSKAMLENTTVETKEIIERTRFMGRWLAKSGSEISIAAALGVMP